MDFPINFEMWQAIVGLLLPLAVAFAKNLTWPKWIKLALMFGLSFVVSFIELIITGEFTAADLLSSFLKIAFLATTAYAWLWNTIGLDAKIAANFGVGKQPGG